MKNKIKLAITIIILGITSLYSENIKINDNNTNIELIKNNNIIINKNIINKNKDILNKKINFLIKETEFKINPFLNLRKEITLSEIIKLKNRIKINIKENNELATLRDKIKLNYIEFIKHIVNKTNVLLVTEDKQTIKDLLKSEYSYLENFNEKIDKFNNNIESIVNEKEINNIKILKKTQNNFKNLNNIYNLYINYIDYLTNNFNSVFESNNFIKKLGIDKDINYINKITIIKRINNYFNNYDFDLGRIFFFIVTILIFLSLKYFILGLGFSFIKRKMDGFDNEAIAIVKNNFKSIKKPLTWILVLVGFHFGFKILYYPQDVPQYLTMTNYILINISFMILFLNVSNILFSIFFNTEENKDKIKVRGEIINLANYFIKFLIIIIAILAFFIKFDIQIAPLLTSLGIGGMAIALASKDTISNIFGSMKIILDKSFYQGEWIETPDLEGVVIEIGLISTKIRTFDNALTQLSNGVLANSPIKNWSRRKIGRRIKFKIGVSYKSKRKDILKAIEDISNMLENNSNIAQPNETINLEKAHKLVNLMDAYGVKKTQLVFLDEMNDSSIDILVYTFSKSTDWKEWLRVKQEVLLKIWEILEKNNLEYAYPTQTIYLENEK